MPWVGLWVAGQGGKSELDGIRALSCPCSNAHMSFSNAKSFFPAVHGAAIFIDAGIEYNPLRFETGEYSFMQSEKIGDKDYRFWIVLSVGTTGK